MNRSTKPVFWRDGVESDESVYLTVFDDLGLPESLLKALKSEGYQNPTPIQERVIPAVLANRDVVGIAQTGTGKTAAFVLPILADLLGERAQPGPKRCTNLILVPTRELASQIADAVRTYGRFMQHRLAVVVGGVGYQPQIRAMARGVDILIATPGRLEDHMKTGAIRLEATRRIVLDEADQMLDLGFLPAIRRVLGKLPHQRQTLLLSATMPAQIKALADGFLSAPETISVSPPSRPADKVAQQVLQVDRAAKRQVLIELLSDKDVSRAIVFTRTKHGADKVARYLEDAGHAVAALHGNKSQGQRERALGAFRSGKATILVATDIAARGIDVDDISHVINFDLPMTAEAYVHRIGRTARAGREGQAISLCDPEERKLLRDIERLIGKRLGGDAAGQADARPQRSDRQGERQGEPRRRRPQGQARGERSRGDHPRGDHQRGDHPRGDQPRRRRSRGRRDGRGAANSPAHAVGQ